MKSLVVLLKKSDAMKTALKVKKLIKKSGMSQAAFAKSVGIHPVSLCNYLKNDNFSIKALEKIAKAQNVKLKSLLPDNKVEVVEEPSICGFIEYNGTVETIKTVADLERVWLTVSGNANNNAETISKNNTTEPKAEEKALDEPEKVTQMEQSDKVYGILGAVIGDIVGSRFEFLKTFPKYNFKMFGSANLFTDDSIMTVAIADALLHKKGFQEAMLEWGRKYPNGGWGGGFRKWLKSDNPQPYNSKGNGCGMRISSVGFYGNTLEEVLDLATQATMPTHGSEEGLKGAKAIASAIFLARQHKPKSEIKKYIEDNFGYNLDSTKEEIVSMVQHFEKGMREMAEYSVPVAIIAFLNGNDFEDTMRIAMTYGGDTDTIGAMLGGISAAYYGVPMNIAQEAVKYLSQDILDVINEFDKTSFVSPRITPSITHEWNTDCIVVYGRSVNEGENGEDGSFDVHNTRNRHKIDGYAIRTIGADVEDTKHDVEAFVQYVKENPQKTFLVKRVGIQKANISIDVMAPLFAPLMNESNVFLPNEYREYYQQHPSL